MLLCGSQSSICLDSLAVIAHLFPSSAKVIGFLRTYLSVDLPLKLLLYREARRLTLFFFRFLCDLFPLLFLHLSPFLLAFLLFFPLPLFFRAWGVEGRGLWDLGLWGRRQRVIHSVGRCLIIIRILWINPLLLVIRILISPQLLLVMSNKFLLKEEWEGIIAEWQRCLYVKSYYTRH